MDETTQPFLPASPHAVQLDQVLRYFDVDFDLGLSPAEAEQRLARHGPNALTQAPQPSWWWRFAGQFKALVIWVLIAAALISGLLGEGLDAIAILAIVLLNGLLGFIQEERAERALSALQAMSAPRAKALRGGQAVCVPATQLVPGDRVEL